jgi:putative tryptophan/tyrosine transport system substrate-binding protein
MRRREFIGLLGGATAWPFAASGQRPERVRRVGLLIPYPESDAENQSRVEAFQQALQQFGWTAPHNIHVDYRWAAGDDDQTMHRLARELVQLAPDVIVAQSTPSTRALQGETSTIPIVFVQVTDPIGAGFVTSLARPGGNITGFAMYEPAMGTKWLELLKEIAPGVSRVAISFNPETAPGRGAFFSDAIEAGAPSFGMASTTLPVGGAADIERSIEAFSRDPNGGLFVMPDVTTQLHRQLIVGQAALHRVPAIYSQRFFITSGGLICYGVDTAEQFRQAASYVDRILRGAKPNELPIQAPTKYEMVVNLKTAKALNLTIPQSILLRADEVIE